MKKTDRLQIFVGALLIVLFAYLCAVLLFPMTYSMNDDVAIVNYLSRAEWGEWHWLHYYTNAITSFLIGGLYILFPQVEWWYVIQHCFVVCGIWGCNYGFLSAVFSKNGEITERRGVCQRILCFILYGGILLGVNIVFFGYILGAGVTWTISPMILGCGMISLIMNRNVSNERVFNKGIIAGIFISLLIACLIRMDTGYVLIAYMGVAVIIKLIDCFSTGCLKRETVIKGIFVSAAILVVLLGVDVISDKIKIDIHGMDYHEYQEARVKYIDHRHDSYWDNEEMYQSIEWDDTIYDCVNSWMFAMDEVDKESLAYAAENSRSYVKNATLYENIAAFKDSILEDDMCKYSFFFAAVLCLVVIYSSIKSKHRNTIVEVLLNAMIMFALLFYLACVAGRVNYRSFILVIMPFSVINIHILFRTMDIRKWMNRIWIAMLLICTMFSSYKIMRITEYYAEKNAATEWKQLAQRKYAYENSENMYFVERKYMISPKDHDVDMAKNIMTLGGGTWFDEYHKVQAKENGLGDKVTCSVFEKYNVFFMGTKSDRTKALLKYMTQHQEALGMALVDTVPGVDDLGVYHFVYEDNVSEFSDYYVIENNEWVLMGK